LKKSNEGNTETIVDAFTESLVEILDEIGTEVMKLRIDSMLEDSDSERNY